MKKVLDIIKKLAVIAAIIAGFVSLSKGDKVEGLLYIIFAYQLMIFDRQDRVCDAKCEIKGSDLVRLVDRESKR